jgi:apolipoprotein N-acyltransferase
LRKRRPFIDFKTYLPAFLTGVALMLSFPEFDYTWLAFVALVPLLITLWRVSAWQAIKAGLVAGIVFFFGTMYWVYHSIHFYGGVGLGASLGVALLLSLYLSMFIATFCLFYSRTLTHTSLPASLIAPLYWVVLEFLRNYIFTGLPWNLLAYSQSEFLRFIQIADITGIYGVSFLIVAVNGLIADIFIARKRRMDMPLFSLAPTLAGYAIVFVLIITSLIYGTYRLGQNRVGKLTRVSIIQGNIEQDIKWNPLYQRMVIDTYSNLSREAMEQSPDLIVWPESSMPFIYSQDDQRRTDLIDLQKEINKPILAGVIDKRTQEDSEKIYYTNSAALIDKGETTMLYDKTHLVPFGEYVPLRKILFFINKLVPDLGEYQPGREIKRGKIAQGEFGTLICFEIIFPNLVRKYFKDGGDFMVNITNDAWFGRTPGPYQHFNMSVFRAIENRKPVVRAANTGISGFINSDGKVLARTNLFESKVLTGDFFTDQTITFYSRFGDIFVYLCTIITIIILIDFRRT